MSNHSAFDRIERWVDLPCSAEEAWPKIGGFLSIVDWHPALASGEELQIEGVRHRRLTTTYGAGILERLVARGPRLLRVSVVESALPMEGHLATLSCAHRPGGCRVTWTAEFASPSARTGEIVANIHEIGLAALAVRFGAKTAPDALPAEGAALSARSGT
ncbi:SRPBCC family protein [uncultured Albimonas sp.]|uniref:SRPBCC family protein n=1 Tax=uncultured Albimonas sp. TaxID=1331701 RepID=UPI0030EF9BAA|tara:strand:+ start:1612 stop:2091 length:480 start_codon:yes stop_codon:yes gene_type:complete